MCRNLFLLQNRRWLFTASSFFSLLKCNVPQYRYWNMCLLHNFTLDIFQPRENKFYGNRSSRCNWSVITKSVMARLQQKCANGLFCTQKHVQKLFTLRLSFKLKISRATDLFMVATCYMTENELQKLIHFATLDYSNVFTLYVDL